RRAQAQKGDSMIRRILVVAAIFLSACGRATPAPTLAPTLTSPPPATTSAAPTATPISTVTATLSPVPTATATGTPTLMPTSTNTPLPSPTPAGYYAHKIAGFNLIYPPGWQVTSQDSTSAVFSDAAGDALFSVGRDTSPTTTTLKAIVA